jgi:CRISPR-associated endonuclease/helicase Cas3
MISFERFFREIHKHTPFPWQKRLADQVIEKGSWPEVLDLPTSSGKTATIDIAVYALAAQAGRKDKKARAAALRTFFVVDRRLVVDDAYLRAEKIADALRDALGTPKSVLHGVAKDLMSFGGDCPLRAAKLRGGMYRDDNWSKAPNQPCVAVTTVDQIGSRLLFRGYGISEFGRSIQAGIAGLDCLYLVDEAHLSEPFVSTLRSVGKLQSPPWSCETLGLPFGVVELSATPTSKSLPFVLDAEDKGDPILSERLTAHKTAELVKFKNESDDPVKNDEKFATETAQRATGFLTPEPTATDESRPIRRIRRSSNSGPNDLPAVPPASVIGVVVNRVSTARRIFETIRSKHPSYETILLTGRIRSHDRDELLMRKPCGDQPNILRYLKADRDRPTLPQPIVVVATQTVEVGADLSFDALVTEAASLDALRQRFGRLDRLGIRKRSSAVIVSRSDAEDVVYGEALAKTWKWLEGRRGPRKNGFVDFGIDHLKPPTDRSELSTLCASRPQAPILLPAHLDLLSQTSPTPYPDPDVSLYLHGPADTAPDVQIVWRADVPNIDHDKLDEITAIVSLAPPISAEAISVPIYAARAWLRKATPAPISDVEGSEGRESSGSGSLWAFRWRGPDESDIVDAERLRAGDLLVVPASYGGADDFGWNPSNGLPVRDIADAAYCYARRRARLRIHPKAMCDWFGRDERPEWLNSLIERLSEMEDQETDRAETDAIVSALIEHRSELPTAHWLRTVLEVFHRSGGSGKRKRGWSEPARYPSTKGIAFIVTGTAPLPEESGDVIDRETDLTTTDDSSSWLGTETPAYLEEHCEGVRETVVEFADRIGIADNLRSALEAAGRFHDCGKADRRFQAWLHDGNTWLVDEARLLAKSMRSSRNSSAIRRARELADYPRGGRHEYLSVLILDECAESLQFGDDRELVRWLVGTHHGRGRPFFRPFHIPRELQVKASIAGYALRSSDEFRSQHVPLERVESGWTDLFASLRRRFGWWGLAYLEAILRLADQRRSEWEGERPS